MGVSLLSGDSALSPFTLGAVVSCMGLVSVPGAPGPELTDNVMPCASANLAAVEKKADAITN